MNHQRISLIALAVFLLAASAASRVYFQGVGGWIAPFLAPMFYGYNTHWSMEAIMFPFWIPLLILGIVAWVVCKPLLTYSYVAFIFLLVPLGELAGYLLAHGE